VDLSAAETIFGVRSENLNCGHIRKGKSRCPVKSKLQQERAVIPAGNHGLGAKTVTSGERAQHIQQRPPAGPNAT
jgi:hypothetical protein